MNRIATIIGLTALLLCTSCLDRVTGSGVMEYRSYNNNEFSAIIIKDACNATVTEGSEYKVEIEIDNNVVKYVSVYQSGETLHIGLKDGNSYRDINFRATITVPTLNRLKVEDASRVSLTRTTNGTLPLHLEAEDASGISGTIAATSLALYVEDASNVNIDGTTQSISLDCSDASHARLKALTTTDMSVQIADASDAIVTVSEKISGNVSDASTLSYYGNPATVQVRTSDASHLIKKN